MYSVSDLMYQTELNIQSHQVLSIMYDGGLMSETTYTMDIQVVTVNDIPIVFNNHKY